MTIRFSKMHSLGNDFVVIDAIRQELDLTPELAARIADRRRGVGCDQLLVAERRPGDDVIRFVIYNSDGTESGQCGNGARCFGRFLERQGLSRERTIRVATRTTAMALELLEDGEVRVDMGPPVFEPARIPFDAGEGAAPWPLVSSLGPVEFDVLSMGNPHAVTVVDDVDTAPVAVIGPQIENHARFPERTNVGFMQVVDPGHIRLRVHERGAGETQACGSGACAAAVSGIRRGLLDHSVEISLPGGILRVRWEGGAQSVWLTGDAIHVFDGTLELEHP